MTPAGSVIYWVPMLLAGVLLVGAAAWPRLQSLLQGARSTPAPRSPGRVLCAGALAGFGVSLVGAALALAVPDPAPGSWWGTLDWSAAAIATGVALLLCFSEGTGPDKLWVLLGAGIAALLPSGLALLTPMIDPGVQLAPLPLGALGAVVCSLALSPSRSARLVEMAHVAAARATSDAIVVVDSAGNLLHADAAGRRALGLGDEDDAGKAGRPLPPAVRELLEAPAAGPVRLKSKSSTRFFEAWTTEKVRTGPRREARALLLRDVTRLRRNEHRLARLAHYDSLTGLPNRRLFLEQIGRTLERARRSGALVALLYVDLDHFKEINDSLGHPAGDQLLQELADRFRTHLYEEDLSEHVFGRGVRIEIARLAGDEFAVVASGLADPEAAAELGRQLLQLIEKPVDIGGRSVTSSGSAGIAMFPEHASDAETLMRNADGALYAAKGRGRNRCAFYESSFDAGAERKHAIEQGLRHALERGELRLHYQPKVDAASAAVLGFEALLRWTSRELGEVGPFEFIPIAEDRGLISEIGAWCLGEACRQIRTWIDEGCEPVPVSVNVSSHQFQQTDLQRIVSESLKQHRLDPTLLELELTESLLLEEADATMLALRDLRAVGIRIALDDFGTGYSALTYLNRFPLDILKMDRGLLRDIEDNPAAVGIASAVVSMAHSLGLTVVAEGVDSEGQIPLLQQMGCDHIQGFLYAPALPETEVRRFLARAGEGAPIAEPIGDAPNRTPTEDGSTAGQATEAQLSTAQPVPVPVVPAAAGPPAADADLPVVRETDLREPVSGPATPAPAPDEEEEEEDDEGVVRADRAAVARGRVLLVDDGAGSLGPTALRLVRLGVDVHHASDPDEGMLLVAQEKSAIRLLVTPPSVDLEQVRGLRDALDRASSTPPPLLVIGEEPDAGMRARIRDAGATWILWSPFEDAELTFVVKSALALPGEIAKRHEIRVPVDLVAKVRAGGRRELGLCSSLSSQGAFVEISNPLGVGSQLHLEFELAGSRFRLFARVVYQQLEDPDRPLESSAGVGVVFHGLDRETEAELRKAVEERAARYLP